MKFRSISWKHDIGNIMCLGNYFFGVVPYFKPRRVFVSQLLWPISIGYNYDRFSVLICQTVSWCVALVRDEELNLSERGNWAACRSVGNHWPGDNDDAPRRTFVIMYSWNSDIIIHSWRSFEMTPEEISRLRNSIITILQYIYTHLIY